MQSTKLRGDHRSVPTSSVRPNGFNYNTQSDAVFDKLVSSMERFGFAQPIVARRVGGEFEILNGEHRWRAAQKLGLAEVPVFDLGEVDDVTAKQLVVVLNELGGKPDDELLAALLRDIETSIGADSLGAVMPFTQDELQLMLDAGAAVDYDAFLPIAQASSGESTEGEQEARGSSRAQSAGWLQPPNSGRGGVVFRFEIHDPEEAKAVADFLVSLGATAAKSASAAFLAAIKAAREATKNDL